MLVYNRLLCTYLYQCSPQSPVIDKRSKHQQTRFCGEAGKAANSSLCMCVCMCCLCYVCARQTYDIEGWAWVIKYESACIILVFLECSSPHCCSHWTGSMSDFNAWTRSHAEVDKDGINRWKHSYTLLPCGSAHCYIYSNGHWTVCMHVCMCAWMLLNNTKQWWTLMRKPERVSSQMEIIC